MSLLEWHIGAGLDWIGPLPARPRDTVGCSVNAVHISRFAHTRSDHEVSIETYYKVQLTPWASFRPDLQYIVTPGGNQRDAVVASVRFIFSF